MNRIDKDNHEGFNLRFAFRESPMVQALRKNHIIIPYQINLCIKSILEGLNSLFDYRKYIVVNNQMIKSNSIIIGTMNPPKFKSRKTLPRSFLDRFIHIEFCEHDKNEILNILNHNIVFDWYGRVSLRECIRIKSLGLNIF